MDCKQAREHLSAILDDALPASDRAEVMAHVRECADCLRELDQLQRVDRLYYDMRTMRTPDDFVEKVRARIGRKNRRALLSPWTIVPALAAAAMVVIAGAVYMAGTQHKEMRLATAPAPVAATPAAAIPTVPMAGGGANYAPERTFMQAKGSAVAEDGRSPERADAVHPLNEPAPSAPQAVSIIEQQVRQETVALDSQAQEQQPKPKMAAPAVAAEAPASPPPPQASSFSAGIQRQAEDHASGGAAMEKTAADRTFAMNNGVWTQKEYTGENLTELRWDSRAMAKLTESEPRLDELKSLGDTVIFKVGDTWYKAAAGNP
jgi:hypothetical protein